MLTDLWWVSCTRAPPGRGRCRDRSDTLRRGRAAPGGHRAWPLGRLGRCTPWSRTPPGCASRAARPWWWWRRPRPPPTSATPRRASRSWLRSAAASWTSAAPRSAPRPEQRRPGAETEGRPVTAVSAGIHLQIRLLRSNLVQISLAILAITV